MGEVERAVVVPDQGNWKLETPGGALFRVYPTRREAVDEGRNWLRARGGGELVVFSEGMQGSKTQPVDGSGKYTGTE